MNPFDQPPVGSPVSIEEPVPEQPGPRRGRMALVAVLTAGLIGGGIAGISQLASADRPELAVGATEEPMDESIDESTEESTDESIAPADDEKSSESSGETDEAPSPSVESEGEIVIDMGDGDPIVIDLGEIEGDIGRLTECIGLPAFDLDLGELDTGAWESGEFPIGDLEEFFDDLPFDLDALEDLDFESGDFGTFDLDGSVTVTGPDGVSVIDLGENGSVTITTEDGEITVATDGDSTVSDIGDLLGEFGGIFEGEFDFGLDEGAFDEFFESLPNFDEGAFPALDELSELESIDPAEIESCFADLLDR